MIDWKVLTVAKQLKDDVSGSLSLGSEEIVGVIVGETDEDYLVSFVVDEDGQGPVGLRLAKASVIAQVSLDTFDWGSNPSPSRLTLEGDGSAVVPAGSPLEAAAGGVKNYETFVEILEESDEEYEVAPRVPLGLQVGRKKILKTSVVEAVEAAALAFNPIPALFSNGEVGAWYDPSDSTTVFQDYFGSTPATVGDPVGLILDKSQGLAADSPELFDGVFETVEDWTNNGNGSWSVSSTGTNVDLRTYPGMTLGKNYILTFDLTITSGQVIVYNAHTAPNLYTTTSGGKKSIQVSATQTWIIFRAVAGTTATISNISSKELPGNHATQTTSSARPVLQIANGTPSSFGPELEDTANTVAGWALSGSNTVELDGDAIKITFVDNSVGASLTMTAAGALTTNLTAGKTYRFSADVKVSAGGSVNATIVSATTNPSTPVTNTAFETLSFYFVADGSNETFRPTSMGAGEVFWIKNISVQEVTAWTGGQYYLKFDGVDDTIATAQFATALAQPNTLSASFVYNQETTAYVWDSATTAARHAFYYATGASPYYAIYANSSGTQVSDASFVGSGYVALVEYNTNQSVIRLDGATVADPANVGASGTNGYRLARAAFANNWGDVSVYSFLAINRTLTAAEITDLETYLASKSGVTLSAGDGGGDGDVPLDGGK